MRKLYLIASLFLISQIAQSQIIRDTLIFYIDQKVEMKVTIEDLSMLCDDSTKTEVKTFLSQLKAHLPSIELDEETAETIQYQNKGELRVTQGAQQSIYLVDGENLKNSGVRDQAILVLPNARIELTAANMKSLSEIKIEECYEKLLAELPEKTRYSKIVYYECKAGVISQQTDKEERLAGGDFIELGVGAAANLYKERWLGEISFKMELTFLNKGRIGSNPYLSSSHLYDFSRLDRVNINTFLNVGYNWDLAAKDEEESLLGIEAGYLIDRRGNLFEENTSRLGIIWRAGKGVLINPQMFIVGPFEKVQPGIRIGFAL